MSDSQPAHDQPPVLVSACLLGLCTRYDGDNCVRPDVLVRLVGRRMAPVCPEQLGGLPTPRSPSQIDEGDGRAVLDGASCVRDGDGLDVTAQFVAGAEGAAHLAAVIGAREAWLKEGSPSCGVRRISRNGESLPGRGVTAALLERSGLRVVGIE